MALTINGVSPTKVIVKQNGVDVELTQIDVVKSGSRVTVWTAENPKWIPVVTNAELVFDIYEYESRIKFDVHNNTGEYVTLQIKLIGGQMDDGSAITHLISCNSLGVPVREPWQIYETTMSTVTTLLSFNFASADSEKERKGEIVSFSLSIAFGEGNNPSYFHTPLVIDEADFTYKEIDTSPETTTTTTT